MGGSSEDAMRTLTICAAILMSIALCASPVPAGQQASAPPTPDELQIYETFRAWITRQPADVMKAGEDALFTRYAAELRSQGKTEKDIASTLATLKALGDRAEIERWNKILTAAKPMFNTEPNAFLVAMTKGLKPGRSLDVGMGQGRNTIYLAQHGWDSVGFDPADGAVAAAQMQAAKLGVKITTHIARAEDFDWGEGCGT